jgi:hypothetical protein
VHNIAGAFARGNRTIVIAQIANRVVVVCPKQNKVDFDTVSYASDMRKVELVVASVLL